MEPKTAHIQAVATTEKHPRLVAWWNDGQGDKSAYVRDAIIEKMDRHGEQEAASVRLLNAIFDSLNRIEASLTNLIGDVMG